MAKARHVPAAALLLALAPACRAELKFTPLVDVRETYSDNINLQDRANARAQWLTDVAPGFELEDNSPNLKLRAAYRQHLFYTPNKDLPNTQNSQSQGALDANAALVKDLFYLDASGSVSQQETSAFGAPVLDNGYTTTNRTTVRTYRVSPYLHHNFGAFASADVRYTRDSVSSNNNGLGDSKGNSVSLGLNSGLAFTRLGWGLQYYRQVLHDTRGGNSVSESASANLRYVLGPTLNLTASGGYDSYDYPTLNNATAGRSWSGGFEWVPTSRTSVRASIGRHYYGKSGSLLASHRSRATVWTVSYDDSVSNTRSNFLLPAAVDTAALLDRLLSSSITDPVLRALAVKAYIQSTGLPPALADSVNYLSNRYFRQRQLQAAVAYQSSHSLATFSVFDTRRQALSLFQSDSLLLGGNSSALNDDTHQIGASLMWNVQLSSRTSVNASLAHTNVESTSLGFSTRNSVARLMFSRQLGSKMAATVEVHHAIGSVGVGAGDYKENAVSVSLSTKF